MHHHCCTACGHVHGADCSSIDLHTHLSFLKANLVYGICHASESVPNSAEDSKQTCKDDQLLTSTMIWQMQLHTKCTCSCRSGTTASMYPYRSPHCNSNKCLDLLACPAPSPHHTAVVGRVTPPAHPSAHHLQLRYSARSMAPPGGYAVRMACNADMPYL